MSKWISVSLIFGLLAGYAEYSHPPARNPQSAHCHAIATQLNQTYPSTLRKRRPLPKKQNCCGPIIRMIVMSLNPSIKNQICFSFVIHLPSAKVDVFSQLINTWLAPQIK